MATIAAPLVLTDNDRTRLELMARSSSLPHRAVTQGPVTVKVRLLTSKT